MSHLNAATSQRTQHKYNSNDGIMIMIIIIIIIIIITVVITIIIIRRDDTYTKKLLF